MVTGPGQVPYPSVLSHLAWTNDPHEALMNYLESFLVQDGY